MYTFPLDVPTTNAREFWQVPGNDQMEQACAGK